MSETEITPEELKEKLDHGDIPFILDVREPDEYVMANLAGYLIPLRYIPQRMKELDPSKEIIVHCHHGVRSRHAVDYLRDHGFPHVRNLLGGIDAWSMRVDPDVPRY